MNEPPLTFEDIGNNQILIEGAIHYKQNSKPLFKKVWETHNKLFNKIEACSPGIDTYLKIFNAVLYIDWYQAIINARPKDKHYFEKEIKRLDKLKAELELFTTKPIPVDFPRHQNSILLELQEYLLNIPVERETVEEVIKLIKTEFNIIKLNISTRDKQIREFKSFMEIMKSINNRDNKTTTKLINLHKKKYKQ